ncbi:MAG TPA: GNAT family N-acetyltransferase [Anaerolineae bacterium]|nr:GNAT family N-acetyltransferase [Anaerolineae bacterium]
MMTIRRYRDGDLEGVLRAWEEASQVAHSFLSPSFLAEERKSIHNVYLPEVETWVAEVEGEVVGFVSLAGNEVGALFVRPAYHRQGIGGKLLDVAREKYPVLELEVFAANGIGRAFYDKYGFVQSGAYIHGDTGRRMLQMVLVPRD